MFEQLESTLRRESMSMKRKVYSASFRAKVAISAIRGDKSIHEIAAESGVSPRMVMNWKKRLQDHVDELFQDHRIIGSKGKKNRRKNQSYSNKLVVSKWRLTG